MSQRQKNEFERARFDRLIVSEYEQIYRFAVWLSKSPEIAEEIVQEAMVRAWRSFDALRDDGSAKAWLLTIVRREYARYFAKRQQTRALDIDSLSPDQEAAIADRESTDIHELREEIMNLDEGYREPLVMQVLMGLSAREIGEVMGISQGAVLIRLHRARLKLRSRYGLDEPRVEDESGDEVDQRIA